MPVDSPHDLYGLPLDQFIPERAALAKSLRGEKRRDEASEVASLRKPSVAAWAVNQLVRTQTKAMSALFAAGDDLVQAQTDAAQGKRAGDAMRDASARQREAVSELVQAAEGLLSSDGHPLSQTTLERVGDTLRAAAIDPEARQQVEDGCLSQELRFVGLGLGDTLTAPPAQAPERPKKPPKAADSKKEIKKADAEAERQYRAALKAARQAESDARKAATRAEKAFEAAQAKREDAAAALKRAEERLAASEQTAHQSATELQNAERAVSELAAARRE